jgi:4-hydroxy-2-oxoheptanedioate aldolase
MTVSFADRLRGGERLVGTVLAIGDPLLAELTCTPFDFVWIDLEHSPLGVADAALLTVAAHAASCAALVRIPCPAEPLASLLDAGVDGVVVPRATGARDAVGVAASLRHPPHGTRGFAHRRATAYGRCEVAPAIPACVVQIESRAALASAEAIASIPGVDAIVIGLADLALDLGVAPALDQPAVVDAIGVVEQAAARAGAAWGLAAGGPLGELAAVASGAGMLVYSADVRMYAAAVDAAGAALREGRG